MRFAYDRFGMGRYTHKEAPYRNPDFKYGVPDTQSSVGLEPSRAEMPVSSGAMGAVNFPQQRADTFQERSHANPPFRAI